MATLTAADVEQAALYWLAGLDWAVAHGPDNPDGEEVGSPHLHVYREGYGDKWAFPVPAGRFTDLGDRWRPFQDFLGFCKIVQPPNVRRGLAA